jgi:hypothetical protein
MKYTISLEFVADRELSNREFDSLTDSLLLQIREPWDSQGNEEEYSTKEMKVAGWFNERL